MNATVFGRKDVPGPTGRMVLYAEVTATISTSPRHTMVIAVVVAGFFAWWGAHVPVQRLPEAGPVVWIGADGQAQAVRQVFVPPLPSLSTIRLAAEVSAPSRLLWTLDLASETDPRRLGRRVGAGAVDLAPGRATSELVVSPPQIATGQQATLVLWFEGAGAASARVAASGLDAYPGRLEEGSASRFGDLRLAVSGLNLYSDLRLRLLHAPPWLRAPVVPVAAILIFLAALTWFIADVTSARGEQG